MRKAILGIVAGTLLAPAVMADSKTETEYRQAVYKSIGGHMTAIVTSLKNQVHMEYFAMHALCLASLANVAPNVFPEGSATEKSKALPAIWENRAEFDAAMDKFVDAANNFATVAESGDMSKVGNAMKALGGSCKGCHDNFKAE